MTDISVIIPVIRYDILFEKVVNSILLQKSNCNFDIVIIIDNPDKSIYKKINLKYVDYIKINKIILIQNQINLGLTKSLNKAINISKGKYIIRNDQDDISNENRIENIMSIIRKNKDVNFIFSDYRLIKNNLIIKRKVINYFFKLDEVLKYKNPIAHSSVLFEKDYFLKIGGYNEKFKTSQDFKLWSTFIYKNNCKYFYINKYLVDIFHSNDSISSQSSKIQRVYSIVICLENSTKINFDNFDIKNYKLFFLEILKNKKININVKDKLLSLIYCYLFDESLVNFNEFLKFNVLKLIILTYLIHPGLLLMKIKKYFG